MNYPNLLKEFNHLDALRNKYVDKKVQWVSRGQEILVEPSICYYVNAHLDEQTNKVSYFAFIEGVTTGVPVAEIEIVEEDDED